jgi:hypothetical protein
MAAHFLPQVINSRVFRAFERVPQTAPRSARIICIFSRNAPSVPESICIVILDERALPIDNRIQSMKTNARFIKSVIDASNKEGVNLPWSRGTRRAAFIAKRAALTSQQKAA